MDLTEKQKQRIQNALKFGTFNIDEEIERLFNQGFTRGIARMRINEEIKLYKQKTVDEILEVEKKGEHEKLFFIGLFMIALIGPLLKISSLVWYLVAMILAAYLGMLRFREMPLAGVMGAIVWVLTFPFFYFWYFAGRSMILLVEILLPMALSMVIAFLVFRFISRSTYN